MARADAPRRRRSCDLVLVSIAAQSEDLLFDAVADARDQGYTWREIAARLACSVRTAHRRFSGYAHQRGTSALMTDALDHRGVPKERSFRAERALSPVDALIGGW